MATCRARRRNTLRHRPFTRPTRPRSTSNCNVRPRCAPFRPSALSRSSSNLTGNALSTALSIEPSGIEKSVTSSSGFGDSFKGETDSKGPPSPPTSPPDQGRGRQRRPSHDSNSSGSSRRASRDDEASTSPAAAPITAPRPPPMLPLPGSSRTSQSRLFGFGRRSSAGAGGAVDLRNAASVRQLLANDSKGNLRHSMNAGNRRQPRAAGHGQQHRLDATRARDSPAGSRPMFRRQDTGNSTTSVPAPRSHPAPIQPLRRSFIRGAPNGPKSSGTPKRRRIKEHRPSHHAAIRPPLQRGWSSDSLRTQFTYNHHSEIDPLFELTPLLMLHDCRCELGGIALGTDRRTGSAIVAIAGGARVRVLDLHTGTMLRTMPFDQAHARAASPSVLTALLSSRATSVSGTRTSDIPPRRLHRNELWRQCARRAGRESGSPHRRFSVARGRCGARRCRPPPGLRRCQRRVLRRVAPPSRRRVRPILARRSPSRRRRAQTPCDHLRRIGGAVAKGSVRAVTVDT